MNAQHWRPHGGLQVGRRAHMDSQWQRNTQGKEQGTLKGKPEPGLCLQQRKTQLMCTAVSYLSFMLWAPLGPSNSSSSLAILCSSSRFWDELRPSRFQVTRLEVVTALHKPPLQLQEAWRCEPTFLLNFQLHLETSARTWLCSCACVCVCVYMYTDSNMGPLRIQPPP